MLQRILAVSEVNQFIKQIIEDEPLLSSILVRGEISNYKVYPSGHHYFTLKDGQSALRCVIFAGATRYLRFRPENGMKVVAAGKISVYPRDGAYQLYCTRLVSDGVGDLHIAFEQLKQKLYAQGLFAPEHKKPLPLYPRCIAIITSPAGAAVHDMIRILRRRYPLSKVVLLPVRVQGVEAPPEIVGAIRYANRFHVGDLIITGRGGGSIEDLWAFNDERVARAIYDSRIPVISAVGHEPDVTISDYVADRRASTPSNAAEIAVPDQDEMREALTSYSIRSAQAMRKRIALLRQQLNEMARKRVLTDPSVLLDNRRLDLERIQDRLLSAEERQLSGKKQRFVSSAAALDAMSPIRVLTRGYAIAQDDKGRVLHAVSDLAPEMPFELILHDGYADCRVTTVHEGEKHDGTKA